MDQGDELPNQACQHCITQVNRWYDFKLMCETTDTTLRQRLAHPELDYQHFYKFPVKQEPVEIIEDLETVLSSPEEQSETMEEVDIEESTIGHISTTFSLREDLALLDNPIPAGILFNGDMSALSQNESLANGMNPNNPFLCTLCDARFPRKVQLKRHIAAHCGEPPHLCTRCDAGFDQKAELTEHMKIHTPPPRPHFNQTIYTCSMCFVDFKQTRSLIHHQKLHTCLGRLQCVFCPKVCASNVQLRFHLRQHVHEQRHLPIRRFACWRCVRFFPNERLFAMHRCTRYHCPFCSRYFPRLRDMMFHARTHKSPSNIKMCLEDEKQSLPAKAPTIIVLKEELAKEEMMETDCSSVKEVPLKQDIPVEEIAVEKEAQDKEKLERPIMEDTSMALDEHTVSSDDTETNSADGTSNSKSDVDVTGLDMHLSITEDSVKSVEEGERVNPENGDDKISVSNIIATSNCSTLSSSSGGSSSSVS